MDITCGVQQCSILGPVLFNLYMLPLGDVIRKCNVESHSYADDTQLHVSVSPDDLSPLESLINCLLVINTWMSQNFLQLNEDRTDVIIFWAKAQRDQIFVQLKSLGLHPKVKNLGIFLDLDLTHLKCHQNIFLSFAGQRSATLPRSEHFSCRHGNTDVCFHNLLAGLL